MKRFSLYLAAALFAVAAQTNMMAKVTEIQSMDQFEEIVEKGKPVVVKFHAEWCGPCKQFKDAYHKVAGQLKHKVTFLAVDIDKNQDIMNEYKVTGVPTVLYFNNGKKVGKGGSKRTEKAFRGEVEDMFDL